MSTPTIEQIVISSYGWANGDVPTNELIFLDKFGFPSEYDDGDTLLHFLLQELVENATDEEDENGSDHWATARFRVMTVLREVQSVHDALMRFGPLPGDIDD